MGNRIDIDAALAERDANLLTITLGGRDWVVPPGDVETLKQFVGMVDVVQTAALANQIDWIVDFIVSQLAEADQEAFRETIRRTRPPLPQLGRIAEAIAMEVSGRPLDTPQDSRIAATMRRLESGPISSSAGTPQPPWPPSPPATGSTSPNGSSPGA